MNRVQTCILALSLGINLAFGGIWLARSMTPAPASPGASASSGLYQRIGVTKDQWAQLAPLVDAFKKASREHRRDINTLRCRLLDLLEAPSQDAEAIKATQDQLYALTLDMKKRAVTLLQGEKEVLTPGQYRALIRAIREKTCCGRESLKKGGSFTRVLINDPDLNGH